VGNPFSDCFARDLNTATEFSLVGQRPRMADRQAESPSPGSAVLVRGFLSLP